MASDTQPKDQPDEQQKDWPGLVSEIQKTFNDEKRARLFDELVSGFETRLVEVLRRISRNETVAREWAQDSFLIAWKKIKQLEDPAKFWQWLSRIGVNVAVKAMGRRPPEIPYDWKTLEMYARTQITPGENRFGEEDLSRLTEVLETLNKAEATLISMRFNDRRTWTEIGEAFGCDKEKVRKKCKTILEKLWREHYDKSYADTE